MTAFEKAWSVIKEENAKPCKDCGNPAPVGFMNPIWELNNLCFPCITRRTKEMGAVDADEETGQPATTMRDLVNAKLSEQGQAGDQQRRDLQ